jgi:hypothetical protein
MSDHAKVTLLQKLRFISAAALGGRLSGTDVAVLAAALEWLGCDPSLPGDCFWTAEQRIADRTGLPRRTVGRAFANLLRAKVLHLQGDGARRGRRRNTYRVPLDALVIEDGRAPRLSFLERATKHVGVPAPSDSQPDRLPTNGRTTANLMAGARPSKWPAHGQYNGRHTANIMAGARPPTPFEEPDSTNPVEEPDSTNQFESAVPASPAPARSPVAGDPDDLGTIDVWEKPTRRAAAIRPTVQEIIRRLDGLAARHPDNRDNQRFTAAEWPGLDHAVKVSLGRHANGTAGDFVNAALDALEASLGLRRSRAGGLAAPPSLTVAVDLQRLGELGLTQAEIARRLRLSRSFIAAVATGSRRLRPDRADALAKLRAAVEAAA